MLSAIEAHKLSLNGELSFVEREINQAAREGYFSIKLDWFLSDETIDILKKESYIITRRKIISW